MNINLSATLEQALTEILTQSKKESWTVKNKNAIKSYNEFIEENGCFDNEFRTF